MTLRLALLVLLSMIFNALPCLGGHSREVAKRLLSDLDFDRAASITISPALEGVSIKRESPSARWTGLRDARRNEDWLKMLSLAGRRELRSFPPDDEIERLVHRLLTEQWTVTCNIDTSKCRHSEYGVYLWSWRSHYRSWGRGDFNRSRVSVKIDLRNPYGMVLAYPDAKDRKWMQDFADGKVVNEYKDGRICSVEELRYLPRLSNLEYYGTITVWTNTKIGEAMREIGHFIIPGWFDMLQLGLGCIIVCLIITVVCICSFGMKMRLHGSWSFKPIVPSTLSGVLFLIGGAFNCGSLWMCLFYLLSGVAFVWAVRRDLKNARRRILQIVSSICCFISGALFCLEILYMVMFIAAVVFFLWFGPMLMHIPAPGPAIISELRRRVVLNDGTVIEEDERCSNSWHGVDGHTGHYTQEGYDEFKKNDY